MMILVHRLVGGVNVLSDKVAYFIFTLSEDTTCSTNQVIGRSVFITCQLIIFLFLFCSSALKLSVPSIPIRWVIHPVSQHVARVMTEVVG